MGLILDTSVFVKAERARQPLGTALGVIAQATGESELGISVMTLAELASGIARAQNRTTAASRVEFITGLRRSLPVHEVDEEIAFQSGLLNGKLAGQGVSMGMADLIIGVTAQVHGHAVMTHNLKHFSQIPGLRIVAGL